MLHCENDSNFTVSFSSKSLINCCLDSEKCFLSVISCRFIRKHCAKASITPCGFLNFGWVAVSFTWNVEIVVINLMKYSWNPTTSLMASPLPVDFECIRTIWSTGVYFSHGSWHLSFGISRLQSSLPRYQFRLLVFVAVLQLLSEQDGGKKVCRRV